MNEAVWNTIKAKVIGLYEAINALPEYCQKCGNELEPTDLGVDPDTGTRMWATYCCGVMDKYEEKLDTN